MVMVLFGSLAKPLRYTRPAFTVRPPVLLVVTMSAPEPTLTNCAAAELPIVVASVKLLPLVSSVATPPGTSAIRLEMSCVLPVAHCSVPPASVRLPDAPRPPFTNESVPSLRRVPPV